MDEKNAMKTCERRNHRPWRGAARESMHMNFAASRSELSTSYRTLWLRNTEQNRQWDSSVNREMKSANEGGHRCASTLFS